MSLKKIAILVTGNFPFGGASANFLRNLSLGLAKEENDIEVLIPTGNYYGNKVDVNSKRKGNIDGVSYKHLGYINHPKNYLGKILDLTLGLILPMVYLIKKSLFNKLDVILVYDLTFLNITLLLFTKFITNNKLVIIVPEFYEKPKNRFHSLRTLNWYSFYFSLKYLVRYADGIIVLTSYMNNYIKSELGYKRNIIVVANVIDPDRFDIGKVKPFSKDKITIGYCGTPTRKDGIQDLLKSFSILNKRNHKTHLLIIGDITNGGSIIQNLEKDTLALGIKDNVTFTGLVSYNKMPGLLKSCQILALIRPQGIVSDAGFPTKLGEYFASKIPVVVTKVGDIPRYFKDEKQVILVEPGQIENIVEGFERLINSKELQQELTFNAFQWLEKNINYRIVGANVSSFINSI